MGDLKLLSYQHMSAPPFMSEVQLWVQSLQGMFDISSFLYYCVEHLSAVDTLLVNIQYPMYGQIFERKV